MTIMKISTLLLFAFLSLGAFAAPAWKQLPVVKPTGTLDDGIKCHLENPRTAAWKQPAFAYDHNVATMPKAAKVIVIIYNPVLKSQGGKTLIQYLKANDPRAYSKLMADAVRECSGGYINYEIVDIIERPEFTRKIDGFLYDEKSFLAARKTNKWHQPDRSNYRTIFEQNDLIRRVRDEGVTEIWIWGAGGFGYDELAMYFPNRYARFAPTQNPWFYRPYEIPVECNRSVWVMGFNYECGPDNMIHSYGHRCESILALVFGHGVWDKSLVGQDPWNSFSMIENDFAGQPSQVGNIHVPPNGQSGYDYNNKRSTMSYADAWLSDYPDLSRAIARPISSAEWGNDQLGYQKWWLRHMPRNAGYTKWGYNNWWVYVANTDEDLPDAPAALKGTFVPTPTPKAKP